MSRQARAITQAIRIALFLLGELVAAIGAIDRESIKEWLCGGNKDMGRAAVEGLMIEWMNSLPNEDDLDRIVAWQLGDSLEYPSG